MKLFLKILFGAVFVAMVAVTLRAGSQVSLWDAWADYRENPWAIATLYDAYFGFLIFYVWVWFKEDSLLARSIWLVLVMTLGSIATSFYVLLQLMRLKRDEPASAILLRRRG